jgi:hypothetical protein
MILIVILGVQLGVGCFGRVVKAEAVGLKGSEETVKTVAVKMVRSEANVTAMEALISELKILVYTWDRTSTSSICWEPALSKYTKVINSSEVFETCCRFYFITHSLSLFRRTFSDR